MSPEGGYQGKNRLVAGAVTQHLPMAVKPLGAERHCQVTKRDKLR